MKYFWNLVIEYLGTNTIELIPIFNITEEIFITKIKY